MSAYLLFRNKIMWNWASPSLAKVAATGIFSPPLLFDSLPSLFWLVSLPELRLWSLRAKLLIRRVDFPAQLSFEMQVCKCKRRKWNETYKMLFATSFVSINKSIHFVVHLSFCIFGHRLLSLEFPHFSFTSFMSNCTTFCVPCLLTKRNRRRPNAFDTVWSDAGSMISSKEGMRIWG